MLEHQEHLQPPPTMTKYFKTFTSVHKYLAFANLMGAIARVGTAGERAGGREEGTGGWMSRRTRNHRAGGEATVGEAVGRRDPVEVDFRLVGIGVSVLVGIGAVRGEVAVPRGARARKHATVGMAQAAAARHEGESAHAGALGSRRLRGGAKGSARGGWWLGRDFAKMASSQ